MGGRDGILLKPGKLTHDEIEEMKKHTVYRCEVIPMPEDRFGYDASSLFLRLAKEIAYTHHEKWDGSSKEKKRGRQNPPRMATIAALDFVHPLNS